MVETGVVSGDFTQILNDFARTCGWQDATKAINPISGTETVTYASSSNISVVFFRNDQKFMFDKEGIVELGDAYIMSPTALGLDREDKITIDSETYIIQQIVRRHVINVQMFDYCSLILLDT